jgi:hypothetical protein
MGVLCYKTRLLPCSDYVKPSFSYPIPFFLSHFFDSLLTIPNLHAFHIKIKFTVRIFTTIKNKNKTMPCR